MFVSGSKYRGFNTDHVERWVWLDTKKHHLVLYFTSGEKMRFEKPDSLFGSEYSMVLKVLRRLEQEGEAALGV